MQGDGVSMPTVLSQLANVAKSQARSQQAASTGANELPPQDKDALQPLKKVPEAEKAEKSAIGERQDGGRRRKRKRGPREQEGADDETSPEQAPATQPQGGLGVLIDRKA